MDKIGLDYTNILPFLSEKSIDSMSEYANKARQMLINKTGLGNDYVGWVDYPVNQDPDVRKKILTIAKRIQKQADVLLVIGIGGSYLGAKAALDILNPYFKKNKTEIIFVGNTLSAAYTKQLVDYLEDKSFAINIISKSGKTLEPALAFRIFRNLLAKKYPDQINERIYATTDAKSGLLRSMAKNAGWETFTIPANIGGRYSIFTAVGLLPLAVAGYDIEALFRGAKDAMEYYFIAPYKNNSAMVYAAIRNLLAQANKSNEFFVAYEPNMTSFLEWLKQLLGESEGKNHLGIFPVSIINTTDLHSLGQYIQDGQRIMFETVFSFSQSKEDLIIGSGFANDDELDSLAHKTMHYINTQALNGVVLAHVEGEVPNIILNLPALYEYELGYLMYFFMFATGISAYILGVNPFDQPGVENYKKKIMELLGK